MTSTGLQKREQEIKEKEKELKEYRNQKFGYEGELFKKRQELIKPVQDKVYDEIQKYAQAKALDFIFDKSSGPSMLFASEKFNKSDEILANMGINKTSGGAK